MAGTVVASRRHRESVDGLTPTFSESAATLGPRGDINFSIIFFLKSAEYPVDMVRSLLTAPVAPSFGCLG